MISHADVIIPVKRLVESKTRLSPSLNLKNRQRLVLLMLEDVLASLKQSSLVDNVIVLTPDIQVADHATSLGAQTMIDKANGGINESLAKATDYEIKERGGSPLLVLPVDIPLVKPSTIDSIVRRVSRSDRALVVISPSIAKGTNALLRNPPNVIPTHYGVNSFDAHVAEAISRKIHFEVYRSEDLEIDADTPSDLYEIMRRGDSTRTSEFLRTTLQDGTQLSL